ncbi:MAG: T9SS type A sorting domain-containing protein [Bacteroidales bacterium]|nr:T9SS type A sorting domain-containing protein [Bacteroidales bacterium]
MMKFKLYFLCFLILSSFTPIFGQKLNADDYLQRKGEVYFSFRIDDFNRLSELTKIISLDAVSAEGEVRAYANAKEFSRFTELGIPFEVLPHPGDSPEPVPMSDYDDLKSRNNWNTYPTYDAYVQMMNDFASNYPNLCQVFQFGTSVQGRKLLMAKITSNVNQKKPRFFYTSTIHGDETGGYVLCLRMIDYLLSNYGTNPRVTNLVDNVEIFINPLANPDGTYKGGNNTVNGAIRYNANYVDLNRNFPDPADGPHPDGNSWQPETVAFMSLADNYFFNLSANFHGGAEVVNYPWDTWSRLHTDNTWWIFVSRQYADTAHAHSPTGYMAGFNNGITNGYAWYRITGGRQDYMTYFQQGREFTLEISNTKLYPASQLPNLWEYNYRSMLSYIEQSLYGIRGIITDSITGQPIRAMVFIKNYDKVIDSSMVFSRLPYGNYHRFVSPGTWALEFSAPGYVTKTVTGVQTSNFNTTYVNVQLRPLGVWANFEADRTRIQPGETVSFTDLSVGGATNWQWSFPGANPSASYVQNPTGIEYPEEGVFDVTLTASNANYNNTQTKLNYIIVGEQYLMGNQTLSTCSGKFYDDGGPAYNYSSDQHLITTFLPALSGHRVRLDFELFDLESSSDCEKDYLKIYDGPTTNSPLLGTWCGNNSPGTVEAGANGGPLTVEFVSNRFVNGQGWMANISCDSGVGIPENAPISAKITDNGQGTLLIMDAPADASLILYDLCGNRLMTSNLNGNSGKLSVGQLPKGMYLLKLFKGHLSKTFKVIIH